LRVSSLLLRHVEKLRLAAPRDKAAAGCGKGKPLAWTAADVATRTRGTDKRRDQMTIKVGDKIPNVPVMLATQEGPQKAETKDIFGKGKVALFAVPGAFTPTCSARHLPGFVEKADELKSQGVSKIVCMSVNDAFVMKAWAKAQEAGAIEMLADGNGEFAKALGLTMDAKGFGMGERSKRFSAIVENGVVKTLNVEAPGAFEVSSAEYLLNQL
jgi:peroxiredoxin